MDWIKKAHHILRNIVIKEVSSVDRGAGEGVRVMLSKRAETISPRAEAYLKRDWTDAQRKDATEKGEAMPGGGYPIKTKADLEDAVDAFGRAKDKAATKAHIITRAKALGATDSLPDKWKVEKSAFLAAVTPAIAKAFPDMPAEALEAFAGAIAKDVGQGDPDDGAVLFDDALEAKEVTQEFNQEFWDATDTLRTSISSILCDEGADKDKMIEQTLDQFTSHIRDVLPKSMEKSLAAGFAALAGDRLNGVSNMNIAELKKSLGLPDTATPDQVIKAMSDKAEKDKKEADDKVEKLAPGDVAYMAKLAPASAEAFQKADRAARDKKMKDEPEGDEGDVKKALAAGDAFDAGGGVILTKRDFGTDAGFQFAKAQAEKSKAADKKIADMEDKEEVAKFSKRATELGLAEDMGVTLRKAFAGGDPAAITKVEQVIKGLQEQVRTGDLFKQAGNSHAKSGKGYDQIMAKAKELIGVEKKLTIEQAFAKIYESPASYDLTEAVKLYKSESRPQ